jgi:hypothetical protein
MAKYCTRVGEVDDLEMLATKYAGRALDKFVEQGGKGLRYTIYEAMTDAILWSREKAKERPRGKNPKR